MVLSTRPWQHHLLLQLSEWRRGLADVAAYSAAPVPLVYTQVTCPVSRFRCHVSRVTCHVSSSAPVLCQKLVTGSPDRGPRYTWYS